MDDLGWSYHLFLETSKWIPGIWMICLKLPGWNQGCHVTSLANPRSRISQFTKNRYWASMLLVGSDSPPEVLDPPKKKLWKRFRYPKDKKPLRLMEILWVGNRLNCLSKVAALCERLVVVGPKHIPKHIARAFFILYFSLMPSWQQQRLAAQSLLIILW